VIRRIESHNVLNGVIFSVAEFAITALVLAPFAVYYVTQAEVILALIFVGIILNCLTIVAFGVRQLSHGERGISFLKVLNKQSRADIARAHPDLYRDTFILVMTILVPFAVFALTLRELLMRR
jgi:hypothetical protein